MINKQRVRRIKNLIYAFFVVLFFLPAVLVTALFFKVLNLENELQEALAAPPPSVVEEQFGLEVKNQANRPEDGLLAPQSAARTTPSSLPNEPEESSASSDMEELQDVSQANDNGQDEPNSLTDPSSQPSSAADGTPGAGQSGVPSGDTASPTTGTVPGDNPMSGGDTGAGLNDHPNTGGPQW